MRQSARGDHRVNGDLHKVAQSSAGAHDDWEHPTNQAPMNLVDASIGSLANFGHRRDAKSRHRGIDRFETFEIARR